jgi:hypothetical protein
MDSFLILLKIYMPIHQGKYYFQYGKQKKYYFDPYNIRSKRYALSKAEAQQRAIFSMARRKGGTLLSQNGTGRRGRGILSAVGSALASGVAHTFHPGKIISSFLPKRGKGRRRGRGTHKPYAKDLEAIKTFHEQQRKAFNERRGGKILRPAFVSSIMPPPFFGGYRPSNAYLHPPQGFPPFALSGGRRRRGGSLPANSVYR